MSAPGPQPCWHSLASSLTCHLWLGSEAKDSGMALVCCSKLHLSLVAPHISCHFPCCTVCALMWVLHG